MAEMLNEEEPGRRSRRSTEGPLAFGPALTFRICVGGGWMIALLLLLLLFELLAFEELLDAPDAAPAPLPEPEADTEAAAPAPARVGGADADGPLETLLSDLREPVPPDLLAPADRRSTCSRNAAIVKYATRERAPNQIENLLSRLRSHRKTRTRRNLKSVKIN